MANETTGADRRSSPHPIPEWEEAAKRLLRVEMARRGWRYQRLALELKLRLGVVESTAQLTRKINRGKFSAAFLLACLEVMGVTDLPMAGIRSSIPGAGKTGEVGRDR